VLRIHAPEQLALVEAEGEGVIRLARSGLPRRFLAREHRGETVGVRHHAGVHRFVEREETRLVCEELRECASARVMAASPLVADQMMTIVSRSHDSAVCLFRSPPQMSTTFSPWT
jgi:hypothetical protein